MTVLCIELYRTSALSVICIWVLMFQIEKYTIGILLQTNRTQNSARRCQKEKTEVYKKGIQLKYHSPSWFGLRFIQNFYC